MDKSMNNLFKGSLSEDTVAVSHFLGKRHSEFERTDDNIKESTLMACGGGGGGDR